MKKISYRLRIDGLDSRLNAGADELTIVQVIVRSTEDLKIHMVELQDEASNFGGLICV